MDYDAYRSYHAVNLEAQTGAASQIELVLVLFDGLLEEIARARGHLQHQRFEQKGESISKCINILNGLSSALDFESGGEVVTNLARLYDYCAHRLYQASVELDAAALDEAEKLLVTLKGGWVGVRDQNAAA
ncbi:flagellar export chaperone FliS [Chromobacterium violaceum]|uniref:Flagellar secretion chaperone FliS n=2 Tax=Chromobacterium violaceum TaxID=536 RepID=A0A1R0MQI9_CHRVL|nr:flagellar export chaperone FliS [Chromobacterium violaceum]AAQ60662.1 flagellar protein FliS [Chromobacterium violaceum ATCC 12472]ATP29349.1 flagellar export chaperone FliS [Chromobacterium violaceum]ATP33256.1 flagellar export chaperone FliS [Chromobacterium violaceum]KJH68319.1 flagellar biosynthesis protein FliS [Chromobacterium violaceum]KMN47856.1 flagellar biosynthesis protein FliS [Chromobacterium violaceum]